MIELQEGDEVRVFSVNSLARRHHEHDPGKPGTVVKVARKLITITHGGQNVAFRLDTQRVNDAYGHEWFATPEQIACEERHAAAMAVLRECGIEMRLGSRALSLPLAEALAAVVETFGQEEAQQ